MAGQNKKISRFYPGRRFDPFLGRWINTTSLDRPEWQLQPDEGLGEALGLSERRARAIRHGTISGRRLG